MTCGAMLLTRACNLQEFFKCNRSIQQLEVKSMWKANELRAALAREGQLAADLDAARARLASLVSQVLLSPIP